MSQIMRSYSFKETDKGYFYIDGTRVSKEQYYAKKEECGRLDCFWTRRQTDGSFHHGCCGYTMEAP